GKLKGHLADLRRSSATKPLHLRCARDRDGLSGGVVGKPGDVVARLAVHASEVAPEQNFPVGLDRYAADNTGARAGIESIRALDGAVRVQSRELIARLAIHAGEPAPEENLPVRLQHHAIDVVVRAGAGIKGVRAFQGAVRIQSDDVVAALAVHAREDAPEE